MPIVAAVFLLVSAAVAILGFSSMRSDIQVIIGLLGLLFSGLFLGLFLQSTAQWGLGRTTRRIERSIDDVLDAMEARQPAKRSDAAEDFNTAILLYQKNGGHKEAASAIRELAGEALRQKGFLK